MIVKPHHMVTALVACLITGLAWAHSVGMLGVQAVDWHSETISRVISPSYAWNDLGIKVVAAAGKLVDVDGDSCMQGHQFNFDISNDYAFDIDESVELTIEVDVASSGPDLMVAYDRNGGPDQIHVTLTDSGNKRETVTLTLPRARFADRGSHATDIKIVGQPKLDNFTNGPPGAPMTICNFTVERSFETKSSGEFGWLDLRVVDETGTPTAMRAGIYDSTDRSALPSADAVFIQKFTDRTRNYLLGSHIVWPTDNRFIFYLDGHYVIRLPAGQHRLVGTHGIEYRMIDEALDIQAGQTLLKTVKLERFANLGASGWYAGDVHIHSARRDDRDSIAMLKQATAEDLNVGNILSMDNISASYFPQQGWGKTEGRIQAGKHALVAGQEGPRTSHRGHLIQLNIDSPVYIPERYLQYHEVLEEVARQGGTSGYGHVGYGGSSTLFGMILDVPFGLIKFLEIAQGGITGTDFWFTFLNLGYRVAPAAGTDYPYLDHPGAHRTYVHMADGYSVDSWFDGLEKGHAFVTNGPLLDVDVNGRGMGDELRVSRGETIKVSASALLSPDIDSLARIELISRGEVIATAQSGEDGAHLNLDYEIAMDASTWLVVRAVGRRDGPGTRIAAPTPLITAISAPIYVVVDGDTRTWKKEAVPGIVADLTARLDVFSGLKSSSVYQNEQWETGPVWEEVWEKQMKEIQDRVVAAKARLNALADEAR